MKKLDSILLKIFLYELPILILYFISYFVFDLEMAAKSNNYAKAWYDFGGFYIFGSWIFCSIYLSFRLMISDLFRKKILTKITLIKERDEREILLTGQAARATMLTTIAILIFLFCFSCFQFSIYQVPPDIDGKSKVLSLSFNLDLLENPLKQNLEEVTEKQEILSYTGLPISSASVILGLIIWQVIAYNYYMRCLMK